MLSLKTTALEASFNLNGPEPRPGSCKRYFVPKPMRDAMYQHLSEQ